MNTERLEHPDGCSQLCSSARAAVKKHQTRTAHSSGGRKVEKQVPEALTSAESLKVAGGHLLTASHRLCPWYLCPERERERREKFSDIFSYEGINPLGLGPNPHDLNEH